MTRLPLLRISRRVSPALAALLILVACGGSEDGQGGRKDSVTEARKEASVPSPASTPGSPARADGGERRQGTSAGKPRRTARHFTPQGPRRRDDFAEVAALVNPAHPADPWPSELLATSAEASLVRFLEALRTQDMGSLRGMITRDVRGTLGARNGPEGGTDGRSVLTGEELLLGIRGALGWTSSASANRPVIEVSVTEVEAPELLTAEEQSQQPAQSRTGRTLARVLIGTPPEEGAVSNRQTVAILDVEWRLGRRVRMGQITVHEVRTSAGAPPFRDVTALTLRLPRDDGGAAASFGGSSLQDLLGLGALEAYQRTDRLCSNTDLYLAMHGAAVGDLDGNGWEDLVVGRATGQPNLLFMNEGGRLVEEGEKRGLDILEDTGGMLIVDLDGDGARDVVYGRGSTVAIAWNRGGGTFDEVQELSTLEATARVYSISAADVDRDGDLDLYDTRYFRSGGYGAQAPTPYHDAMNGAANVFWRNLLVDGEAASPRAFRDDTEAVGLDAENDRFSLTSVFDDLDGDGDLDLYVANDFGRNSFYAWEGSRFRAVSEASGLTDKAAGMGISVADVDLDGESDIVISNMHSAAGMRVTREAAFGRSLNGETRGEFMRHARGNTLYRGLGGGRFQDVSDSAGASPGGWAWGARFVDWDRDGLSDIVVPNGFISGRTGPDLQSFF
ncbi:MAG: VCBS repeat-containing protein, partial [Planctomycetota bacterium]